MRPWRKKVLADLHFQSGARRPFFFGEVNMRIGVIGGDVDGLVAARLLADRGHEVSVFETEGLGLRFQLPTFKYLEDTTEVKRLLDRLDLPYGGYPIQAGLLINGNVVPCRKYLLKNPDHANRIHFDYYRKTRLAFPVSISSKGIDDPECGPSRKAISCDYTDFVRQVTKGFRVLRQQVKKVLANVITTKESEFECDRVVVCDPLWKVQGLFAVDVPDAMAVKSNVIQVEVIRDRFLKWDFVYTPYTPGQRIHRVYHNDDGYACQFSGELDEDGLQSDLNFLFPDGWHIEKDPTIIPGHLLPLPCQVKWPDKVIPVGKYARWDPKATLTDTIKVTAKMVRDANA